MFQQAKTLLNRPDLMVLGLGYFVLLILRGSYFEIARWPWCLVPQLCMLLGTGIALSHWRRLGQPFDALVGFTLVGLVGTAAFSPDPARSWWYLTMAGGYFAVLYGVVGRLRPGESLLAVLALGQVSLSLASLYQYVELAFLPAWRAGTALFEMPNIYPLGHHNFVSGYLALTLPVTLSLAGKHKGRGRLLWLAALGLGLPVLYTTQSRGGWLGVAVGCGLTLLLSIRLSRRGWLGLIGTACLVGTLAWFSVNGVGSRAQLLLEGRDASVEQRLVFWQTGFALWREHPLFGVGQGVTGFVFPGHRTNNQPWMARTAQQLHNTPIHLLAETGLWGLVAYLGWLGAAALLCYRHFSTDRASVAALAGGLVGYGLSSLTDFQLENPAISATLVLIAAEMVRLQGGTRPAPRPVQAVAIALAVFVIGNWIRMDWAWWESARAFAVTDQFEQFTRYMRSAERIDPGQPYYPLQYAQVALEKARTFPPLSRRRRQLLDEASLAADRAVRLLPTDALALTNAGWLYLYRRDWRGAEKLFGRALHEDSTTTATAQLGMGLALVALGKAATARPHFLRELVIYPDQWSDERWQTPSLHSLVPGLAAQALAFYDRLLSQYPGDADLLYLRANFLLWQGRDREVLSTLATIPLQQVFAAHQPIAIRLPWRVARTSFMGLRIQALARLAEEHEMEKELDRLERARPQVAACLQPLVAESAREVRSRTYLATGQDYFLLRRTDGQPIAYFEPRRAEHWAAMDCIYFGEDGRNGRLPID